MSPPLCIFLPLPFQLFLSELITSGAVFPQHTLHEFTIELTMLHFIEGLNVSLSTKLFH